MATNKYMNSTLESGSKVSGGAGFPGKILYLTGTYEKAAADNDTSVLRIGTVPANAIPLYHLSRLNNDALTGATDIDIGLYKPNGMSAVDGAVVDKDLLSDGLNIASGAALASAIAAFQTHPTIEEFGKTLKELVESVNSITTYDEAYDVAITGNTFGTATGTIAWSLAFLLPQQ